MKKILALCLSLCLLFSCFTLVAGAAEEDTPSVTDRVTSLLVPQTKSLHVKNGLVYSILAEADAPLAFGNGNSLTTDKLFNVSSYQADESLRNVDYDYSITGRFSFDAPITFGTFAQVGPLSLNLVKNPETDSAELNFEFDPSYPSVTAPLEPTALTAPIHLAVIAKMEPNYVGDGALGSCNHSFSMVAINGMPHSTEDIFASTPNVKVQSLILGETPVNVHSLQIYNRELSVSELSQNIFADVLYAYGLTALDPSYMTDAAREAYVSPLFSTGDPYALTKEQVEVCLAQGATAIAALDDVFDYSAFLMGTDADEYWAETHNELLNIASEGDWNLADYFTLDEAALESFHDALLDMDPEELTEESVTALVLASLEDINPYEELMESLLTFDGYQARLENTPAIRARFSVDHAVLAALEADGFDVTYGATLQNANGTVQKISTVYGEDADLAPIYMSEETSRFAMTLEAASGDQFIEECNAAYIFGAFVSIDDGESVYTVLISCENELFGATASIKSVCSYFVANGYADAPTVKLGAAPEQPAALLADLSYTSKEL